MDLETQTKRQVSKKLTKRCIAGMGRNTTVNPEKKWG